MGVAYCIVADQEIDGIDLANDLDGKCLARAAETFVEMDLFTKLGIMSLDEFLGGDGSEYLDILKDMDGIEDVAKELGDGQESWFFPEEGLKTVNALAEYLSQNKDTVDNTDDVLADLEAFKKILTACDQQRAKWYLTVDM